MVLNQVALQVHRVAGQADGAEPHAMDARATEYRHHVLGAPCLGAVDPQQAVHRKGAATGPIRGRQHGQRRKPEGFGVQLLFGHDQLQPVCDVGTRPYRTALRQEEPDRFPAVCFGRTLRTDEIALIEAIPGAVTVRQIQQGAPEGAVRAVDQPYPRGGRDSIAPVGADELTGRGPADLAPDALDLDVHQRRE